MSAQDSGADRPPPPAARNGDPHGGRRGVSAVIRLLVAVASGVVVGAAVCVLRTWPDGVLLGWITTGTVFVSWMWIIIWPMNAETTAAFARREDPGRAATETTVLVAAVASLGAVAAFLTSGSSGQESADLQAALTVLSVALAWVTVHTVFTTRYARLYYADAHREAVDFNEDAAPQYSDFAYLAFTIGMTFQVSDTDLKTKMIRRTALRHALLSFMFGAIIIATTINLVAGLAK